MRATQSDYILRLIEQLGAALRRLAERLGRDVSAAPEVMADAEQAQAELFGAQWPLLRALDAATAASLVADRRQLELWIELLRLQASAAETLRDDAHAAELRQRAHALELALEARP